MKKPLILALLLVSFLSAPLTQASYKDVSENSPYKAGVDYLELIGATDNHLLFHPENPVNKAEFYKIVFKVFETDASQKKSHFTDVASDAWFAPYAAWAQNNLLETGSLFEPEKGLTKLDALQKLMQAYGISGGIVPWDNRSALFSDVPILHPYYSLIHRLAEEGILTADPQTPLNPFSPLTRGDFANLMLSFDTWHVHQEDVANSHFYKSDIFASIWKQLTENFYLPQGSEIDPDALFQAAIKGMVESLGDPYTTYFTPDQSNEFTSAVNGNFEGIGAYLDQNESEQFVLTNFVPHSPASESGLQIGDILTHIDDVSLTGLSLNAVIKRIQGAEGTEVKLTVLRGENTFNYTLTRAAIQIDLVSSKIVSHNSWYIDIDSFGATTTAEFIENLDSLKEKVEDPTAIVLDLRSNGGGYIMQSNQIAGFFVPYLTRLVTLDYGSSSENVVNADKGLYHGVPLYVLVNSYTASASEILALDLRESDNAVLIGTQTFGKGSAQTLVNYWDGSELKLTIAHWLSGQGTSIHEVGITPDVLIETDSASDQDLWLETAEEAISRL